MRADRIDRLQRSIFGGQLGEWVTVAPPSGMPVRVRAVWIPAGSSSSGTDDVDVVAESDQFAFRRRDTAAVAAADRGATIMREGGDAYVVDSVADLRSETHRVVVIEAGL